MMCVRGMGCKAFVTGELFQICYSDWYVKLDVVMYNKLFK